MDVASLVHGIVMVIMIVGITLMNKTARIQLQRPFLRLPGRDLQTVDLGNTSATITTVFSSGMCAMVSMTVEMAPTSGFALQHQFRLQMQQQHPPDHAISGNSLVLMAGVLTMATSAMV